MRRIAIIDYGMGNIRSVQKACEFLGHTASLVHEPSALAEADHVILPGVGAFADAIAQLRKSGFDKALRQYVCTGKPLLGICLGMQLFFESCTEGSQLHGIQTGLGFFPGLVTRFPSSLDVKIPHIGWNEVETRPSKLFAELPPSFYAYFVHSYQVSHTELPSAIGLTQHGHYFVSAVEQGNVLATQFHPEKSGTVGLKILENFLSLTPNDFTAKAREKLGTSKTGGAPLC